MKAHIVGTSYRRSKYPSKPQALTWWQKTKKTIKQKIATMWQKAGFK